MSVLRVAAVQAGYPLMDRDATVDRVAARTADAAAQGAEGNTVIVAPDGTVIAGPVRRREEILIADLDLREVAVQRRHLDPVGHYNRPDIFRLHVDTAPRPPVIVDPAAAAPQNRKEEPDEHRPSDQRIRG